MIEFSQKALELSRKFDQAVNKSLNTAKEMHKAKRRQYLSIRDDMKKLDGECLKLDEDIFRLKYEIDLSNKRIEVLNKQIEEYNKDKAERDKQAAAEAEVKRKHDEYWDLTDLLN